jgi:uncharacterized protein (TIGR03000 family)
MIVVPSGGGVPYQDSGKKDDGKEKVKPPKPEDETAARPAQLVVTLPADARLKIDGEATVSTSSERIFETPTLPAGKKFSYTLQAEVTGKDGKALSWSQKVSVQAGQVTRVTLTPPTGVASR